MNSSCQTIDYSEGRDPIPADSAGKILDSESGVVALRVPGFLKEKERQELLRMFKATNLSDVETGDIHSSIRRMGATQGAFCDREEKYFEEVDLWKSDPNFAAITGPEGLPVQRVSDFLSRAFRQPAQISRQNGKTMWPSVIRTINAAQIHIDSVKFSHSWEISNIQQQFAWNIYLQLGSSGGGTMIYHSENLAGETTHLQPAEGELILFRCTLPHEVLYSKPAGQRITLNGMAGLSADGKKILYWA